MIKSEEYPIRLADFHQYLPLLEPYKDKLGTMIFGIPPHEELVMLVISEVVSPYFSLDHMAYVYHEDDIPHMKKEVERMLCHQLNTLKRKYP